MNADESLESQVLNLAFLEEMYQRYQEQPGIIDPSWSTFFQNFKENQQKATLLSGVNVSEAERVIHLLEAFRKYGHLAAHINPLALEKPEEPLQLNLTNLGFTKADENQFFPTLGLLLQDQAPLSQIVENLKKRYSSTIGFEFKNFTDANIETWMQQQIESDRFEKPLSLEDQLVILDVLTRAEVLENFLHTKHVGKKRFSLEGAETLIPMLTMLIAHAAAEQVSEIFIGMSHRGRLNVLANILDKSIASILKDFDEDYEPTSVEGMGDIRYHKGHSNDSITTYKGQTIKLTVAPNPSHLESVNSVVEGQTHAKQFLVQDEVKREHIIPLLMHGDAALAGQGVVYETLQMSKLAGFETGGTIHIVINNQVGFTTSPKEARSTLYCTDIAHTFGAPVLHVNAEDPENCVRAILLALEVRQKFHCDVFIDLNCYRKYGHNEGDEPSYTQPINYQTIRNKKSIRTQYFQQLQKEGKIDPKVAEERESQLKQKLQEAYSQTQEAKLPQKMMKQKASGFAFEETVTQVKYELLKEVAEHFSQIPNDFHIHPKLANLMKERTRVIQENQSFDWGTAEYLAYGTLVWEGAPVRLAGQDSGRGTFSHRHALWVDQVNNQDYYPLAHLREGQARFEVLNTCLSEAAALGFEYGYSVVCKNGLTIWEAQFGDFVNSAQVIIDQYIASGEEKWGQTSNLVLFLPHGFEGQGPEHSSARFERFLTLAGHENMQIVNPTTPAQIFHLLRRQVKQSIQKPLIVMTPKGLLRHPACVSEIKDLTEGQFYPILDDPKKLQNIKRLILCTGRIYYDLEAKREKEQQQNIAIIRVEQLYPLDQEKLKAILSKYSSIETCAWVQDEPENMGAWPYIALHVKQLLPMHLSLDYIGREQSATPATGFYARHKQELADILNQAFNNEK